MNFQIGLQLNPTMTGAQLNALMSTLKKSLGALGKDIQLLSPDEIKNFDALQNEAKELAAQLAKDATEAKGLGLALDKVETSGKGIMGMGAGMSKAFQFNQITQSVNTLALGIQQLSEPLLALDTGIAKIRAIGPEAAKMADSLKGAALDAAKDLPFSAGEFAETYADAIASGVQGGAAELSKFGNTAAKLAVGGDAGVESSRKLLAGVLNAFGETADAAEKYGDKLFNVVNAGVLSVDEMNASMSQVTPTAAALGVDFDNIGGALALATTKGVPFAQATTKINALLLEMAKPGAALAPILKEAGVNLDTLANEDIAPQLERINGALAKTGKTAIQVFSSSEASAGFNVLAGDLEGFSGAVNDVRDTAGSVDIAYSAMADSMSGKTNQVLNTVKTFLAEGIDKMGPAFVIAGNSAAQLAPMVTTFAGLKQVIPTETIAKFGGSIKDVVLPALVKLGIVKATGVAATVADTTATVANTAVKGAQAVATTAGTTAQYSLNTAMLANPAFLLVAGIGAVVAAFLIFSKKTKDVETAIADVNKALEDFGKASETEEAVKKQSDSLDKLADKYDKLSSNVSAGFGGEATKSQQQLSKSAQQLAQAVPEAAEAIDVLNAKGERIGTTFKIDTEIVKQFTAEQKKMAAEAKADAFANLIDQGASLVDSYRESTKALGDLKKARDEVNKDTSDTGLEMILKQAVGLGLMVDTEEERLAKLKETRAEIRKQSEEQQKAKDKLREIITTLTEQKKTTKEIAKELGLTTQEVQKLGAQFGVATIEAKKVETATTAIAASTDNATKSAKELAEAYKKVKESVSSALDTSRGATLALRQEQATGQQELAQLNRQIAQETDAARKAAFEARKADLEKRLAQIPGEIKAQVDAARQAVVEQKKLEREELRLNLEIGAVDYNVKDFTQQAASVWREIGKINFDAAKESIKDEAVRARKEIELNAAGVVAGIRDQIKGIQAEQAKRGIADKIIGADKLIGALRAKITAVQNQARADMENAEEDIRKARLEKIRKALEEELKLRGDRMRNVADDLNRAAENILNAEDRLEAQIGALEIEKSAALEEFLSTSDKYVEAYAQIQGVVQEINNAITLEEKANAIAQINARTDLADAEKALLLKGVEDAEITTEEKKKLLREQVEAQSKALQELRTQILNDQTNPALQKLLKDFLDKNIALTSAAAKVEYDKRIALINEEFDAREKAMNKYLGQTTKMFADISKIVNDAATTSIEGDFSARKAILDFEYDSLLFSQEFYNMKSVELEERKQKQLAAIQAQAIGAEQERERVRTLGLLALQKARQEEVLAAALKSKDDKAIADAKKQLQDTSDAIMEQGDTLQLVARNAADALTNMTLQSLSGQHEAARESFRAFLNMMIGALTALASAKVSEAILNTIGPTGIPGLIGAVALKPVVEKLVAGILSIGVSAIARFGSGGKVTEQQLALVGDLPTGGNQREWIFTDTQLRDVMIMVTNQVATQLNEGMQAIAQAIYEMPKEFRAKGGELRLVAAQAQQARNRRVIYSPKNKAYDAASFHTSS